MAATNGLKKMHLPGLGATLLLIVLILYITGLGPQITKVEETLPSQEYGQVQDVEGNVYPTIAIGKQVWMAENLRNTTFNCGDSIQVMFTNGIERGPDVRFYDGKARFAYYENKKELGYGVIYSYSAITKCSVCPDGFRIPTKSDWEELLTYLGGKEKAGKQLLKNGSSGFNAQMGGRIDSYGSVLGGRLGHYWCIDINPDITSDYVKVYIFEVINNGAVRLVAQDSRVGNYVRCMQVK